MPNKSLVDALETPMITLDAVEADRYSDLFQQAVQSLKKKLGPSSLVEKRELLDQIQNVVQLLRPNKNGRYNCLRIDTESGFPAQGAISGLVMDAHNAYKRLESFSERWSLEQLGRDARRKLLHGEYPEEELRRGTVYSYFSTLQEEIKEGGVPFIDNLGSPKMATTDNLKMLVTSEAEYVRSLPTALLYDAFPALEVYYDVFDTTKNLFVSYGLQLKDIKKYLRLMRKLCSTPAMREFLSTRTNLKKEITPLYNQPRLQAAIEYGSAYPAELMFDILGQRGVVAFQVERYVYGPFFFSGTDNPECIQGLIEDDSYVLCLQHEKFPRERYVPKKRDSGLKGLIKGAGEKIKGADKSFRLKHGLPLMSGQESFEVPLELERGALETYLMQHYSHISEEYPNNAERVFYFAFSPDIAEKLDKNPELKKEVFGSG